MALPKLSDVPKYEAVVPSTGQKVRFRPFLVKEEKVLLIAMESQDTAQITNAVLDIISSCVDDCDASRLTSTDVEYLFLKIRAKSVGETIDLKINCIKCEAENDVKVNVDTISIDSPEGLAKEIKLTNNIILEVQPPAFSQLARNKKIVEAETATEQIFAMVRETIVAVKTDEERTLIAEVSDEEFNTFIESMSGAQFTMIREYVESLPRLHHEIEYNCTNCDHKNVHVLEGLQSFFS